MDGIFARSIEVILFHFIWLLVMGKNTTTFLTCKKMFRIFFLQNQARLIDICLWHLSSLFKLQFESKGKKNSIFHHIWQKRSYLLTRNQFKFTNHLSLQKFSNLTTFFITVDFPDSPEVWKAKNNEKFPKIFFGKESNSKTSNYCFCLCSFFMS